MTKNMTEFHHKETKWKKEATHDIFIKSTKTHQSHLERLRYAMN